MKQRSCMVLMGLVMFAGSQSQARGQGQNPQEGRKPTQTASVTPTSERPGTVSPEAKASADYVIGADDVLDVSVWKEQELTRTLQVRPDGKISMPLLNDIQAAGLTTNQLSQSINEKLKKYLTAPQVTVI